MKTDSQMNLSYPNRRFNQYTQAEYSMYEYSYNIGYDMTLPPHTLPTLKHDYGYCANKSHCDCKS